MTDMEVTSELSGRQHLPGTTHSAARSLLAAACPGTLTRRPSGAWQRLTALLCLAVSLTLSGCASGLLSMPSAGWFGGDLPRPGFAKDKTKTTRSRPEDNDFTDRVHTPLLNEYISVEGNTMIPLRGVGLVIGLDGTGDDPPPSALRTQLQAEMERLGIKESRQLLASKSTALVMVLAYLPAMVREDDRFDARVMLPPNSEATSLKGGVLLETRLFEEQSVEGRGVLKGHEYAVAHGAILTALGVVRDPTRRQAELMRGTIPGGAVSRTDRDLSILLRSDKRTHKNIKRISDAVSTRFHHYNRYGQAIPLATGKTDKLIELKVHPTYRNNFPRYQAVIRSVAYSETDVARRLRMEQLEEDLMDPDKAQSVALQLEAVGSAGIPFLKNGLKSPDFAVRFHSAQALAYLGDASGVDILTDAARNDAALRVFALAAMSVVDEAEVVMALRELITSGTELETRYGAFVALKELDPADPYVRGLEFPGRFVLHATETSGAPMVHVRRYGLPEVVLFGGSQPLRLPILVSAGPQNRLIRISGDAGEHSVVVTRYALNAEPERKTVPNRLADVIAAVGEFGASYPDIVQMLIEAEQQHNLVGDFGIDQMPEAGRLYVPRDGDSSTGGSGRRMGNRTMTPGLFDRPADEATSDHRDDSADDDRIDPLAELDDYPEDPAADLAAPRMAARVTEASAPSSGDVPVGDDAVERPVREFQLSEPGSGSGENRTAEEDDSPHEDAEESSESADEGAKQGLGSRVRQFFTRPFATRTP